MTCPSCGRIAGAGLDRCAHCGSRLDIPADRPHAPIPVVRAPTNRGELAQRAAGVVTRVLVPTRPADPVPGPAPAQPAPPPPALGAPVGAAAPLAGGHAPPPRPTWPPPEATPIASAPIPPRPPESERDTPVRLPGLTFLLPPPPPPIAHAVTAGDPTTSLPAPVAPVDPTAVLASAGHPDGPAPGATDLQPATETNRVTEEPDEDVRRRAVRAGVDASWPPPPGPWSGRRTQES